MEQRQQLVLKIWTPTLTSAKGMGKPLDFSSPWGWSVLQDGIQKVQWGCKTLQQPAAPAMQRKAASCVKLISSAQREGAGELFYSCKGCPLCGCWVSRLQIMVLPLSVR